MSRYRKGKTNLDFTEARDSEWQWHQLGHMQVCTSLQTNYHASTPPLCFLQTGCPSCCPTNSVKALKATHCCWGNIAKKSLGEYFLCCTLYVPVAGTLNTHTHTLNCTLSGTTRVGRYQKGKTNLDFTEARDSEWQWHQLGHMQVCTSLQADNHASTPLLSFLQAGCPS